MAFSLRGTATGGVSDGHRFPDPPAHGEREPMVVMRDALLSQLHMALLRQEIIEAKLGKIEGAMALLAATGGHQTQTTPLPMPWHGVATADAGRSQPWPFSTEQPMAQQNAEFDDPKLPDSNKDALVSQLHMARLRREIIKTELAKIERDMVLCATTVGHQTQTMQMPMPWHGVAAVDAGRSKSWPFNAELPMAQQNAEFDEHKLPDSNKIVPPSKASPVEKLELTGITIPVMKMKPAMEWNCTVCQMQATSEQNLQQHYDGQKHLSNVATLNPTTKASDQKAKSAVEHSLGTKQKKTSSIKWSCSTCQANGTSQSTLEAHLKGKRHQQNIAATCVEGDTDGMPKIIAAQEEKSHGINVPKNSEKPWPFIAEQPMAQEFDEHKLPDSNKVQAISEQDQQQHCAGQKLLSNVATVDPTTKASDQNVKTAAEPSLRTEQKKTSSIKWSCSTCQANGTSQLTLEAHLKGKRHHQNIAAASVKWDKNGMPWNVAAQEAKSHGINVPKNSEKPPSTWSCSICQVICTCQIDLTNHLRGIRHREKVQSLLEQSKSMARDSESQKAKLNTDSRWICNICHAHCTSESDLENHLVGTRHQLNIQVLREKIKQEENNPPQVAKNQGPFSKWNCTMCEAKCNSESQFEGHCRSSKHRQKIHEMLGKGKIDKASSSRTANELPSDGSNGKNARSEMAEKQPALYFCEVCNFLFESSTMLVHHRFGKKHRAKLSARNEFSWTSAYVACYLGKVAKRGSGIMLPHLNQVMA